MSVTLSSSEEEYVAFSEVCAELISSSRFGNVLESIFELVHNCQSRQCWSFIFGK